MNSLVQESLLSTGHVEHAAIIRKKDATIKAKTASFDLGPQDVMSIIGAFERPTDTRENGLKLDNMAYQCVRCDNHAIYAKTNLGTGLIAARTGQFLICGLYGDGMIPSVAAEAVEKLADYFRRKGK